MNDQQGTSDSEHPTGRPYDRAARARRSYVEADASIVEPGDANCAACAEWGLCDRTAPMAWCDLANHLVAHVGRCDEWEEGEPFT